MSETGVSSGPGGISRRAFLAASSGAVAASVLAPGIANAAPSRTRASGAALVDPSAWDEADVVFDDPCDDLVAAGWTVSAPQAGVYALDSAVSVGNPFGLALPAVAAGTYLVHADQMSVPGNTYLLMTHPLDIGPGAWRLDMRMKINDIPHVYETFFTRGLCVTVTANHYSFAYTLVEKDQFMAATGSGGVGYTRTIPVPFDGQFHDWSLVFDGADTSMLMIDDVVISRFRNVNLASSAGDSIQIMGALAAQGKSGALDVEVDTIRVRRRSTAVPLGDGSDLGAAGWQVDPATTYAYITDYARTSGTVNGMLAVAKGDVILYGKPGVSAPMSAAAPADLGGGTWALRFFGKFIALSTGSDGSPRGMGVTVRAGGQRYDIWFAADALSMVDAATGATLKSVSGAVELDATFRQWTFGVDEQGRFYGAVNGSKVIDGVAGLSTPTTEPDGLELALDTTGAAQGPTKVYVNRLELVRAVDTEWHEPGLRATVLPHADAAAMPCVLSLPDADPLDLAAGSLTIDLRLAKDNGAGQPGDELTSTTLVATASANPVTLNPGGYHGEAHLIATLSRGAEIVYAATTRYALPASHGAAAPGQSLTPAAGESLLFADVDACTGDGGADPVAAGWSIGTYTFDGTADGGVFLDSTAHAQELAIPLSLHGWCAVYVGFVSGTEELTFGVGGASKTLSVYGAPEFDVTHAFGPRATGEVLAHVADFDGETLTMGPVSGKQARIAYLRVVGLTADQTTVASTPAEAITKRVIYNNDGYSLFGNYIPDAAGLEQRAINMYEGADVEALTFQAGTTFFFNYTSAFAGAPYASMTPEQAALMRNVDKTIKQSIDGFVARNEIPAEILAARGQQIDVKTYAGMRMDIMYRITQYPWLNGNLYDVFKNHMTDYYNGTVNPNYVSYSSPEFQEYLTNVIGEQSRFVGVAGVDLDFCRYPNVLGYEQGLLDAYSAEYGADARTEVTPEGSLRWQRFRATYVTAFMRALRASLGATKVIARIPVGNTLAYGLDVAAWVNEGLIDVLVPSAITSEPFWDGLDVYTSMVQGTPVKVYGGTTGTLGGTDTTKADEDSVRRGFPAATGHTAMDALMYQERASEFYHAGYDGMYLFNYPSGAVSLGKLGDRVENRKWRVFELPAIWIQDSATAQSVGPGTLDDLARQLSQSRAAGALSDGEWHRLDAQVRLAQRMAANGSATRATAAVEQFVAELRRCRDRGDCSSSTAGSLIATARTALTSPMPAPAAAG